MRDAMRTTIVIDDQLIAEAMKATGLTRKKAVVEAGLRLLVQVHAQSDMRRLRGKVNWQGNLAKARSGRLSRR
jgi:Arc/MetJ family transcription regulator